MGSIVSENAQQIVIKRPDGSEAKFERAQVSSRVSAPSSMPEIYGQVMSRSELRDLMAFMRTLTEALPSMGTSNRALADNAESSLSGGHE